MALFEFHISFYPSYKYQFWAFYEAEALFYRSWERRRGQRSNRSTRQKPLYNISISNRDCCWVCWACCCYYQCKVGCGFPWACTLNTVLSPDSTVTGCSSVTNTGLLSSICRPRPTAPTSTTHSQTDSVVISPERYQICSFLTSFRACFFILLYSFYEPYLINQ